MRAHLEDTYHRALPSYGTGQMLAYCGDALSDRRRGQVLSRPQIVFDLIEDPGITDGCPADHDPIHAISFPVFLCFFRRIDISVTEDGNPDAWVFFHLGDKAPVGRSFIQLRPRAAMDAQRLDACILQAFGHLFDVPGRVVPAKPGLYGDRQGGAFYHGRREAGHGGDILQYCRACALAYDFFDRAAEIDVYQVRLDSIYDPGAQCHGFLVAPEDLDAEGTFIFQEIQFCPALDGIPD